MAEELEKEELAEEEVEEIEVEVEDGGEEVEVEEEAWEDPGKKEGDEEHEPPADSKRFKQVYGKMKELERTIEDIREHGMKSDPIVKEMVNHNKRLAKAMEKVAENVAKVEGVDEVVALETKLSNLREARKDARTNNEDDKLDGLNDEIVDIQFQIREAREAKVQKAKEEKPAAEETVDEAEIRQEFVAFVEKSPWFDPESEDFDSIMQGAAMALDKDLQNDVRWSSKPLGERYSEVNSRIVKRFGWEGTEEEPEVPKKGKKRPSAPAVEAGNRKPKGSGGVKVKLTADMVNIAEAFGLSPQEYAKQLAADREAN